MDKETNGAVGKRNLYTIYSRKFSEAGVIYIVKIAVSRQPHSSFIETYQLLFGNRSMGASDHRLNLSACQGAVNGFRQKLCKGRHGVGLCLVVILAEGNEINVFGV